MIYAECNGHSFLVMSLTRFTRKEIDHEIGKPRVCNRLKEARNGKALIDEDPFSIQPPYIERLGPGNDLQPHGLKLLRDVSRNHDLIILCPELGAWLLGAAKEVGIDVRKHEFPGDPKSLHHEIERDVISGHGGRTRRLLEDLKDSQRLRMLRRLLESKGQKN